MKKAFKIVGWALLGLVIFSAGLIGFVYWEIKTGRLVYWEDGWYSREEIREKYGPQVYRVESKNAPEEVYAKFREALLKGDVETALTQVREHEREKYREALKNKEGLDKWAKSLPEKITKEEELGNFATYHIDYGTKNRNTVDFIKNKDGYWEIDSI